MLRHLYAFRPGEAAKKYPRWQFGLRPDGKCGALITHHIPNVAWRHAITKNYESEISKEETDLVFCDLYDFKVKHPEACLKEGLWADSSEKANSITRDQATNTLCLTFSISKENGDYETYYSVRETFSPLYEAAFFEIIMRELLKYDAAIAN